MQSLFDELRIEIFKQIDKPISLSLCNKTWYEISRDPHARAEWLIYKHGRAHALFHAVRLGNKFITSEVVQALLSRNVILSRYFVQRLLMHFGHYDEKLIELKIEHNVNQVDFDRIRAFQKKLQSPWASNLTLQIFTKLITEGYNLLNDEDLATKGNDMELFHFLSAGPLVINYAPQKLLENIGSIEDLIKNKKFIPFPPRPKPIYEDTVDYIQLMQARAHEEYPPKDGYENSRQLNVVARAILIHPELVVMWKEIGYYEICNDVNELVMQGALLILFPPTPPNDWERPGSADVEARLRQLINLGFQLTDTVIEEAFHLFEHKLDEIGDILMSSFQVIRKQSRSSVAYSCLIKAIRPERNHKKTDLLDFLMERIENSEEALEDALEYYNVGFKLDVNLIKSTKIRSLTVHSNFYYWILKNYGRNSNVTQKCFEDIIESRVWIDVKLQETPGRDVPEPLTNCAYKSICSIYLEFCNEKVPFRSSQCLSYLQLVNDKEVLDPFFGLNMPILFGLEITIEFPLRITHEYSRPEIRFNNNNNKRKFNEMNNQQSNKPNVYEMKKWLLEFKNITNFSGISQNFKIRNDELWEKLMSSEQIRSLVDDLNENEEEPNFTENSIEIFSKRIRQ